MSLMYITDVYRSTLEPILVSFKEDLSRDTLLLYPCQELFFVVYAHCSAMVAPGRQETTSNGNGHDGLPLVLCQRLECGFTSMSEH
jgi:hypothetical protein